MTATVQARLDRETKKILDQLAKRLGWSRSEIVPEAIRMLDTATPKGGRRIIGQGMFPGPKDLATNKKHMEGFGL